MKDMALTLSLNTNPLVNRFAEPDDLIDAIAYDIGIRDLQLTHEFVNPGWPAATISKFVRLFRTALDRTGVRVTSGMTGPYGRLNHFGHPDADVRRYYVDWFKTFADITADLGGRSVGTQFAIFTYRDYDAPARREDLIRIAIDAWAEVADHAKAAGLDYVFWEPMSIGREFGETIPAAMALQDRLTAADMAIPMWMMADIDHGDVTSPDPDDLDPYAWARAVPLDGGAPVEVEGRHIRARVPHAGTAVPGLLRELHDADVTLDSIQVVRPTLDDVFLTLTGRSSDEIDDLDGGADAAAGARTSEAVR